MNIYKVEDYQQIEEMVVSLRNTSKHILTNMFLSENTIKKYINDNKVKYEYLKDNYLNIYVSNNDFVNLYFYVLCTEKYDVCYEDLPIVCNIYFVKDIIKYENIIINLTKKGFLEYKKYSKWTRNGNFDCNNIGISDIEFHHGYNKNFKELIKKHFDIYSDNVFDVDLDDYFFDKKCFFAINTNTKKTIAGIVISKKGNIETEEYIFVDNEYRGLGIAKNLHKMWYISNENNYILYSAWIRDDNNDSINLHSRMNFNINNSKKLCMIKKGDNNYDRKN